MTPNNAIDSDTVASLYALVMVRVIADVSPEIAAT